MDHDDEFEYHITFPQAANVLKPELTENEASENDPIVVLLGWGGCLDKHLAKYSAIYEKQGLTTVRYVAPIWKLFSSQSRLYLEPHAQKIIEMLLDMNLTENGIFFHVFSNGGSLMYDLIRLNLDTKPEFKEKVLGCIFDSTPARVTTFQYLQAVYAVIPGGRFRKYLLTFVALVLAFTHKLKIILYPFFFMEKPKQRTNDIWYNLVQEPARCAQLFLYSAADKICGYETIEEFIDQRKSKGVEVQAVNFEDSAHVQHYLAHPQTYAGHVLDFIKSNINKVRKISPV